MKKGKEGQGREKGRRKRKGGGLIRTFIVYC